MASAPVCASRRGRAARSRGAAGARLHSHTMRGPLSCGRVRAGPRYEHAANAARKDGRLVMVRYDGDLVVKRLMRIGTTWCLQSDNQGDPMWRKPHPVEEIKDFEILGRVRWVGSWRE